MSEPFKYASAKNQQRNLDARLTDLETKMEEFSQKILPALFNTIQNISNQFGREGAEHEEAIQALIQLVGEDEVVAAVNSNRKKIQDQAIVSEMAVYDAMVKNEILLKAEEVTDKTVIVGTEYKEDGTPLEPLRVPLVMEKVTNETLKAALIGKKIGERAELVNNRTFEVLEVYVQNPNPPDVEKASSREEFGVSESVSTSETLSNG